MIEAIEQLTSRERQVLALVAVGLSNKEIARELDLSLSRVKDIVCEILNKLQVPNRTAAAAAWAARRPTDRDQLGATEIGD